MTLVRSWASLTIYGQGLDIEALSAGLAADPSGIHCIGDTMHSGQPFPHDMWSLDSPLDRSEPLDAHLEWLQVALSPHYEFLRSVGKTARVVVQCWVQAFADSFDFRITPERMTMFTEIGIPWGISAILWGAENREESEP